MVFSLLIVLMSDHNLLYIIKLSACMSELHYMIICTFVCQWRFCMTFSCCIRPFLEVLLINAKWLPYDKTGFTGLFYELLWFSAQCICGGYCNVLCVCVCVYCDVEIITIVWIMCQEIILNCIIGCTQMMCWCSLMKKFCTPVQKRWIVIPCKTWY